MLVHNIPGLIPCNLTWRSAQSWCSPSTSWLQAAMGLTEKPLQLKLNLQPSRSSSYQYSCLKISCTTSVRMWNYHVSLDQESKRCIPLQLQHRCFWLIANGECLLLNPKPDNWEEWVVTPMTLCCSNQRPDIHIYASSEVISAGSQVQTDCWNMHC
jgi:hypothetical protein